MRGTADSYPHSQAAPALQPRVHVPKQDLILDSVRLRPGPRPGRQRGNPPLQPAALRDGAAHGHCLRRSRNAASASGYKDVTSDEFWVRGHMPGMPLMPGVIMCEAAAQLCSYHVHRHKLMGPEAMLGFGGLDEVRFRGTVVPGDRLVIAARSYSSARARWSAPAFSASSASSSSARARSAASPSRSKCSRESRELGP